MARLARIGVCYFPEHWPPEQWPAQARIMREIGIEQVRIGEFAWSRIEPARGRFEWDWLDAALATLAAESLQVVLCTPTACPPKWLVDEIPTILPCDEHGRPRRFGSRRHYRFASDEYRRQCELICRALFERYAHHPAVIGWQLDNEYGCHDTTLSYSDEDLEAFRHWLRRRYHTVDALNAAWGTVFWSQEYRDFEAVELPAATVTEANPAHRMDFRRFASEQVTTFNRAQAELLRDIDGGRAWLTHNCMGLFTDFDHFALGADLDLASWDSYPLGFLDVGGFSAAEKAAYRRIGHPDFTAFNHDVYRAVGAGRWGVMEQQPGPVNWAASNAQPLPGAVRFWAWEAIAHGAEFVSYFRYRQLPVAQEQMHAAIRLPDGTAAPAQREIEQLVAELRTLPDSPTRRAEVALVFDYPSCWATAIQPHTPGCGSAETAFTWYCALRRLGLDVDIVSQASRLEGYRMVILPAVVMVSEALAGRLRQLDATVVIGPRCGSRTEHFAIPAELAPGPLQALVPLRVVAVDGMRRGVSRPFRWRGREFEASRWYETVESGLQAHCQTDDGADLWYSHGDIHYLNAWLPEDFLVELFEELAAGAGIATTRLPAGLRLRRRGEMLFAFNFGPEPRRFELPGREPLLGSRDLAAAGLSIWPRPADD